MALIGCQSILGIRAAAALEMCGIMSVIAGDNSCPRRSRPRDVWNHERRRGLIRWPPRDGGIMRDAAGDAAGP
jgi:hypothetical protein